MTNKKSQSCLNIKQSYFDWMYRLVFCEDLSFSRLAEKLHDIPFRYSLPMDGNREADGINLRYRFGYESRYEDYIIAEYLDNCPCSVLEMMTALYIRCEEQIIGNSRIWNIPKNGGYKNNLFWEMLKSLGLDIMNNENFNDERAENVVSRFLDREYSPNGEGGLFTVNSCERDMRSVEIWYQMCKHLDETLL